MRTAFDFRISARSGSLKFPPLGTGVRAGAADATDTDDSAGDVSN